MTAAIYVLVHCLLLFIRVADFAMLARMIVNLLFMGEPTRIGSFLYVVTEPFILPIAPSVTASAGSGVCRWICPSFSPPCC